MLGLPVCTFPNPGTWSNWFVLIHHIQASKFSCSAIFFGLHLCLQLLSEGFLRFHDSSKIFVSGFVSVADEKSFSILLFAVNNK